MSTATQEFQQAAERGDSLKALVDAQLGPLLETLGTLSPDGDRKFCVSRRDDTDLLTGTESCNISIGYSTPADLDTRREDYDYRIRPEAEAHIARDAKGALSIDMTHYAIRTPDGLSNVGSPKRISVKSFDALREQLELGLRTFATDRLPDIGAAMLTAEAAQPPTDKKIGVFSKPLRLGRSRQESPAPESAKKRPWWKLRP